MNRTRKPGVLLALGLGLFVSLPLQANIWIFEPSISLDQRFDDNYYLLPDGAAELSATRAVGDLGLSRESTTASVNGKVRVDSLLTNESDIGDGGLDVNGLLSLDTVFRTQRSRFALGVSYKADTPSRDIAADISDEVSVASDTGQSVTQSLTTNVGRSEIVIKPSYQFDITRRLTFNSSLSLSQVKHELPLAQDVIYQYYLEQYAQNNVPTRPDGSALTYSEVNINTVGGFTTSGELSDFAESELEIGLRYKLSPISTAVFTGGLGRFVSEVEVPVQEASGLREPDDEVAFLDRSPRRDSVSTKSTFKLGYERFLRPNLQLAITGGVYTNTTDNIDIVALERDWGVAGEVSQEEIETDGWLADVGLTFDSGTTRYSGRFSVDVQPSSSGTQVETQELIGELFRVLSPRSRFAFRARAYEPDRLAANPEDRFSRRFISFEPKLEWKFSRNWTLTTAYRYRRQKARMDSSSAQSNALLFAVKYTPPSEIRDTARANGL